MYSQKEEEMNNLSNLITLLDSNDTIILEQTIFTIRDLCCYDGSQSYFTFILLIIILIIR